MENPGYEKKIKRICGCCLSDDKKRLVDCLGAVGFFFPEKAAINLVSLKKETQSSDLLESIVSALVHSFDPDRGLNNLLLFVQKVTPSFGVQLTPDALNAYCAVFSGSQYLSEILFNQGDGMRWFLSYDETFIRNDLAARIDQIDSTSAFLHAVQCFKDYWFLNIGARDLLRLDTTETVLKKLSLVADICLDAIYNHCYADLEKKYGTPMEFDEQGERKKSTGIIIGMGKLGGFELNFSSDIDLIFVYSSEKGETLIYSEGVVLESSNPHKISNNEFFTLLAQRITRIIGEELKIFRVDLDLRPEGKSGAITQCLTGTEIYYESWGQTWERMAMIKARPVAGDRELGKRFLETIHPFVYRKYLDESSLNEIKVMRDRIKRKLESEGKNADVKLGDGGIREIEFVVQIFQFIYGGKIPKLQERRTIMALHKLEGLLPAEEIKVLDRAYYFLRDIENRLQMLQGRQTHQLPVNVPEQVALARKMGRESWKSFMNLYQHHTGRVKNIFDTLFTSCSPPAGKSSRSKPSVAPPSNELESYKDPDKIRSLITLLREGHTYEYPTQKCRELFDRLLPRLLSRIGCRPDPHMALNRFEAFSKSFGARETLFGFLLENKPILELLIQILGTGGILCERLIQFPDFLDLISRSETFWEEKTQMRKEIEELLQKSVSTKEKLELLAKYKMEEEFRIGIRLIAKNTDTLPIFEELSQLAQLYLEQIVYLAFNEVENTQSLSTQLAVIAVGKFGGKELDFGSDLDIVFVSSDAENSTISHKICRKVIELSQTVTKYGVPYRIDLDLRPYGKSGPLVVPLSGFRSYYQKNAKPWERMAWIRSRVVIGEGDLFCRIHEIVKDFVYGQGLDKGEIDEIEQIWRRVHQERTRKGRISLKFGSGGLFDLEFITQLLQLKWGNSFPDIQRAHIYQALLALEQNNRLSAETAGQLKDGYMFLRNIESCLRLTQNQPGDWIGQSDEQWELLSKKMLADSKVASGKALRETFQTITDNITQTKYKIGSFL